MDRDHKRILDRDNKRILVVDDNQDLLYLLSIRLVSAGFSVLGATNGLEALEKLEHYPIDVVLTDYQMPQMDGLEFLSVARVKWPGLPVVIHSGGYDDMAHEATAQGAFAWMRKETEFPILVEILNSAVDQSVHG